MDFVSDALATERALRTFTLIDSFTKESLAIKVNTGISSRQVARVLDRAIEERGTPDVVRCDKGPEFTSLFFVEWCKDRGIRLVHIQPGKPVQNGPVESLNGRFRDECLNTNWFVNLRDARQKIEAWRNEYNGERPHSSLAYRTPWSSQRSAQNSPAGGPPPDRTAVGWRWIARRRNWQGRARPCAEIWIPGGSGGMAKRVSMKPDFQVRLAENSGTSGGYSFYAYCYEYTPTDENQT